VASLPERVFQLASARGVLGHHQDLQAGHGSKVLQTPLLG
jgi:hypothetical protein